MQIKIINKSTHELPNYETIASAGMDLRANITESITLNPLEILQKLSIPTAQVRPASLTTFQSAGPKISTDSKPKALTSLQNSGKV